MRYLFIALIYLPTSVWATTYYLSAAGSDANNGTSTGTTWRTPDAVRAHAAFNAGDSILFKCGDTFQGEFSKTYTGAAGNPIVVASYGSGAKPIIYGDFNGCEWTALAGRDSMYKMWVGGSVGLVGYEYYSDAWHAMTVKVDESMYYLSNADSMNKYLNLFTASSVGPYGGWDTLYVKTKTGAAPNVKILREGNIVQGSHFVVRDLDLRNWVSALTAYSMHDVLWRKIYTRNTIMHTFLLETCTDVLTDSCRTDSTSATVWFDFYGNSNTIRVCSTYSVTTGSMGLPNYYPEQCVIGMQTDTNCVAEYIVADDLVDAFFDSGELAPSSYAYHDTVRYCTITNAHNGFFAAGNAWAFHDNTIEFSGVDKRGFQLDIQGSENTAIFNNTLTMTGLAAIGFYVPDRGAHTGTVTFSNNTVKSSQSNSYFDDFDSDGITSTGNTFCGPGKWATGDYPSYTEYATLALFQAQGYESGSVYYSDCDSIPTAPTAKSYLRWRK
jgi:hypothetical protein